MLKEMCSNAAKSYTRIRLNYAGRVEASSIYELVKKIEREEDTHTQTQYAH